MSLWGLGAVTVAAQGLAKGTWEASGMAAWSIGESSGGPASLEETRLVLSPSASYYPTRFVFLGPTLDYSRSFSDIETDEPFNTREEVTSSAWNVGLQLGFLGNWSPGLLRPLPYLGGAVGLSTWDSKVDDMLDSRPAESHSDNGHFFALFVGAKLRLSESFLLNLQPTFTWSSAGERESHEFAVRGGFSGLF